MQSASRRSDVVQRYNPFRPGSIVTTGMFAGRYDELIALERALYQTKNGNPAHFLVHGERGIGKSSLLFYLQLVACGKLEAIDDSRFSFVTVSIELEPTTTYVELIKKIGSDFQRAIAGQQRLRDLAHSAWDFLKRWEVMGVKYSSEADGVVEPHQLLDELTYTVNATLENLGTAVDGTLILIDEADKPSVDAQLGEFAKLFTERLTKRGCNRVALGLAGQTELLEKLRKSHESSPRVFQVLTLEPLAPQERIDVVRRGLTESKNQGGTEVTITSEAENWISSLSEGYPSFIQQFAHCAFECDTDNVIDHGDVIRGATMENGALQQLGYKYFHAMYFEQIKSEDYRHILNFMSQKMTGLVTIDEIRSAIQIKPSTLNNAIVALKKHRTIVPKPGVKGVYRLPTNSFATWIRAFTASPQMTLPSLEDQA